MPRAVLESVGAHDAVVVGQSMGGWTALGLALARPDLVSAVVLSDTTAGNFRRRDRAQLRGRHGARAASRERAAPARLASSDRPPVRGENPDRAYLYQLLTSFGAPTPGRSRRRSADHAFEDERLRTLRAPVLFVVGEHDQSSRPTSYDARPRTFRAPRRRHRRRRALTVLRTPRRVELGRRGVPRSLSRGSCRDRGRRGHRSAGGEVHPAQQRCRIALVVEVLVARSLLGDRRLSACRRARGSRCAECTRRPARTSC